MDQKENIRFKAVCDISPYKRDLRRRRLRAFKHDVKAYESYKELLAKETDLDAVIVATPDWVHAPISIACMKAGLHVYCEKEMSNSLKSAKEMVETAKKTKKLLQIGHQRRSNPRYIIAEQILRKHRLAGKIKNACAQWNRPVSGHDVPLPSGAAIVDDAILKKHGYGSMHELINWRWYEKFGGGPLADLGSHQIDIFGWFLGDVNPTSVLAVGGKDYFKYQQDEDVMAVYEYKSNTGIVRAFYQVLNTSGYGTYGGYYETFMGDIATLLISEFGGDWNNGWLFREKYDWADKDVLKRWEQCEKLGLVGKRDEAAEQKQQVDALLKVGGSIAVPHFFPLLTKLEDLVHGPHLKNFFDAIRDSKVKLNCPGEEGYRTAVAVLRANEAIQNGIKVKFKESDFKV
jgi:predicted dehydrogenase